MERESTLVMEGESVGNPSITRVNFRG